MRLAATLLVAAVVCGCSRATRPAPPPPTASLPTWAVAACASVPVLRSACVDRETPGRGGFWQMFIGRPRTPSRVAYVLVRHGSDAILVGAAPARGGLRTFGLAPAARRPVSDWLSAYTGTAVDDGPRRWGGVTGRLVMTRSAAPAWFEDLIAFTWTDGPWRRVIAIAAFGPYARAVATLREVVSHRPTTPPIRELVPAGVAMVQTPRWVRLLCGRDLRRTCPTRMPAPNGAVTLAQADARRLDLAWGVHLTVSAGPRRAVRPVIALGRRHWTTPAGTLSIGARDCFGNHACYSWAEGRRSYVVSLHARRPLARTLATLAQVVRSIPGR